MPEFDVVELDETQHPTAGDEAPDFVRPLVDAEEWTDTALSDVLDDGPAVLVFHSMDGAFPATYAWNEIRERDWTDREVQRTSDGSSSAEQSSANHSSGRSPREDGEQGDPRDRLSVVGVSISTPYEHKRLIADRGIDARLFSDPANGVAEAYGIVNDLDGMAGIAEPRPAVFVIDTERTVQYAWVASEWPDFPDYDDVEAAIDAL